MFAFRQIANLLLSIAVCLFYGPIYASIAELASSIPSSGGGMSEFSSNFFHNNILFLTSLSLVFCRRWSLWQNLWVACWLVELPGLDLCSGIHFGHSWYSGCQYVLHLPPNV